MHDDIQFQHIPLPRYAIRFGPAVIRDSIPDEIGGVYVLTVGPHPIYVGRSDQQLRRRLLTHGFRHIATHFAWRLTQSNVQAYHLECAWYHAIEHFPYVRNIAHPSKPAGSAFECPVCKVTDIIALRYAVGDETFMTSTDSCPRTRCAREFLTTVSAE